MSDAPERLWIDLDAQWRPCALCDPNKSHQTTAYNHDFPDAVGYILASACQRRLDLQWEAAKAMEAEREQLQQENQRLRDEVSRLNDIHGGPDQMEKDINALMTLLAESKKENERLQGQIDELGHPWISVDEALPGYGNYFDDKVAILIDGEPGWHVGYFLNGKIRPSGFYGDFVVTHWMPLPAPPQENNHD